MSYIPESLIPITMFISAAWVIKTLSDNKVRKTAIEKSNLDQETLQLLTQNTHHRRDNTLKWGMVFIGVGLALLIARIFQYEMTEELALGLMLVFAGAALIIFHRTRSRRQTDKEEVIVEVKEDQPKQEQ